MRSVLAYGWALGGLGIGPEGGHMVLGNDAGLHGEMGSMLEMSGLGGAHACLMGVSRGSWYCRWGAIPGSLMGCLCGADAIDRVRTCRMDCLETG